MRRGLIAWSPAELPASVLDARLARLRAEMSRAGIDTLALYTNLTRPAAASWLTGFVPYWSEGLALVPRTGAVVLIVALSKRVQGWIERTSHVGRVVSAPRIGLEAGRILAAAQHDAIVGVVEYDGLPAGIADDLREGGTVLRFRDATALIEACRAAADPSEIALAAKAGAIAQRALSFVSSDASDSAAVVGVVEAAARRLGAEECYVAAAPDLGRDRRLVRIAGAAPLGTRFALRATVAYKGNWIRMVRTISRDAADGSLDRATADFAGAVAALPDAGGFGGMASWLVEGCRAAQPLEPLLGSRVSEGRALAPGSIVSVQATIEVAGQPVLLGAPALVGYAGQAASLLVHPLFDAPASPSA